MQARDVKSNDPIPLLPYEIMLMIFSNLNTKDFLNCMLITKEYNARLKDLYSSDAKRLLTHISEIQFITPVIDRFRNKKAFQEAALNMERKNPLTTHETLLFALLTDDIYKINAQALEKAIQVARKEIEDGQMTKLMRPILDGLDITLLVIKYNKDDNKFDYLKQAIMKLMQREYYVNLSKTRLTSILHMITDISLAEINFRNVNLENVNLSFAILDNVSLNGANLRNADLYLAKIKLTKMQECLNLDTINFFPVQCFEETHMGRELACVQGAVFEYSEDNECYQHRYVSVQTLLNAIAHSAVSFINRLPESDKKYAITLLDQAITDNIFKTKTYTNSNNIANSLFSLFSQNVLNPECKRILENAKNDIIKSISYERTPSPMD